MMEPDSRAESNGVQSEASLIAQADGGEAASRPIAGSAQSGKTPHARRRKLFDDAHVLAMVMRREAMRTLRRLRRSHLLVGTWRGARAERLLIAPQDIRTADATVAADIYAGHLVFGDGFVDAHGQSPFDVDPPSDAWAEALNSFGWLRHLRAANSSLARANARALVDDWITTSETKRKRIAWRLEVVSRRVLSWLAQSPIILAPPDAAFYRRFTRSLGRQVAFLRRAAASGGDEPSRLIAAVALAEAGLCAEGLALARKQGSRLLTEELQRQIFADGGHISRNPSELVQLLLDLLPLRQAYAARSAPVPPPLLHAIDRMIPMIRLFRHGDGTLALFNGMGVTEPDALATVLTYDDVRARPLTNAPHSGYQRLEAGGTLVICDTGPPPPAPFDQRAHAGALSFELSVGSQRVIVNCGHPAGGSREVKQAARSTAAHSTLVLEDSSSCRFAPPGLRRWFADGLLDGPRTVPLTRGGEAGTQMIEASHDGYLRRFGLLHLRRLELDRSGASLLGLDCLTPAPGAKPGPAGFALRFHLHPAVQTEPVQGGTAIMLTLPSEERWLFEVDGTAPMLEESIMFAASPRARPTSQIVVEGRYPDTTALRWTLTRLPAEAELSAVPVHRPA